MNSIDNKRRNYPKANIILNDSLRLLGYTDNDGNPELSQRIRNKAIVTVNLVYGDLWRICKDTDFEPITSLDDEIKLPKKATGDVFLYGLAMHLARNENDGDQQQYFAYLYNSRRAGLTKFDRLKNIIPRGADI